MIKRVIAVSLFALSGVVFSGDRSIVMLNDLEKGVGVTRGNFTDLVASSPALSVARSAHRDRDAGFVYAFLKDDPSGVVYSLSREPRLFTTNFSTRELHGHWPLTRWSEYAVLEGESPQAARYFHRYEGPFAGVDDIDELRSGELEDAVWRNRVYDSKQRYGCLRRHPLRYGDVTGDGEKELVVFSGNEIVIFSPAYERVIMGWNWLNEDEAGPEGMRFFVEEDEVGGVSRHYRELGRDAPQYLSRSGTWQYVHRAYPAWRSFAKAYFGAFSGDDAQDVIIYRRLYESLPLSAGDDGFERIAQALIHYARDDQGVYKLQQTREEEIRVWLEERELTWADGWPRESECDGEEGQLIPEMHDPLLNDPDVLEGVDPEAMTLMEKKED